MRRFNRFQQPRRENRDTRTGGREAAARILGQPRSVPASAVFCANDLLALGVLQELTRQHIRVPEEIALVGYDDIEFAVRDRASAG